MKFFTKNNLLICGILSTILYVIATILGALKWAEYDSLSQSVSELIAINAPSAPLVIPLFLIYSLLVFAFGIGIWLTAENKKAIRVVAILIIAKAVIFGAKAFGKRFYIFSIVTILVFLFFGTLAGMDGSKIAENLPTPYIGVWERINIFIYFIWVNVLAINLLRMNKKINS